MGVSQNLGYFLGCPYDKNWKSVLGSPHFGKLQFRTMALNMCSRVLGHYLAYCWNPCSG